MRAVVVLGLMVCLLVPASAQVPAPSGPDIVSPDARLELLFTRTAPIQGGLTEGPAVAPDGSIYFSDIPRATDKGMILRFDPGTGKTTVFANDSYKSNGLVFDRDGYLWACEGADYGGRAISRWDTKRGQREKYADNYRGKLFNAPNDICVDRRGRLYFTDPKYVGHEERELEHRAVYRLNRNARVIEITHEVSKPNGLALSPDGRTLYVAEHDNGSDRIDDPEQPQPTQGDMKIYAFPLDTRGLVDGERRVLVDFGTQKGCDGMTVDEAGNLYLTVRTPRRPGVMVVEPEQGKEIAFIPTGPPDQAVSDDSPPRGLPSNVEFGIGDEQHVLYITVDVSLYRIPLLVRGYHHQYQQVAR